jgi:hypothetical protein
MAVSFARRAARGAWCVVRFGLEGAPLRLRRWEGDAFGVGATGVTALRAAAGRC